MTITLPHGNNSTQGNNSTPCYTRVIEKGGMYNCHTMASTSARNKHVSSILKADYEPFSQEFTRFTKDNKVFLALWTPLYLGRHRGCKAGYWNGEQRDL